MITAPRKSKRVRRSSSRFIRTPIDLQGSAGAFAHWAPPSRMQCLELDPTIAASLAYTPAMMPMNTAQMGGTPAGLRRTHAAGPGDVASRGRRIRAVRRQASSSHFSCHIAIRGLGSGGVLSSRAKLSSIGWHTETHRNLPSSGLTLRELASRLTSCVQNMNNKI